MTALKQQTPQPLFDLGACCMTRGVHESGISAMQINEMLYRHSLGDWGEVCIEDQEQNRLSLKEGMRILSAYAIDPTKPCKGYGDNCLWVITEADRRVTTVLLPSEY